MVVSWLEDTEKSGKSCLMRDNEKPILNLHAFLPVKLCWATL